MKYLRLDLDDLYTEGYYYTDYNVGDGGHSIIIDATDKKAFLDAFTAEWRKRAEAMLEEWPSEFEVGE